MLSVDQPAGEENGKGGWQELLAWSGNFKLGFENIKYSEDFGNLLQVLPGINNYASGIYTGTKYYFYNTIFYLYLFLFRKGQASWKSSPMGYQLWIYKGKENKSTLLNNWEATYFKFDEQKLTAFGRCTKSWSGCLSFG